MPNTLLGINTIVEVTRNDEDLPTTPQYMRGFILNASTKTSLN
jgi:hypothetical protein